MPIHRWIIPKGYLSAEEKGVLSEKITDIYEGVGLPRFYVVVFFVELEGHDFYYGGKPAKSFVRIDVEHIARNFGDAPVAAKKEFLDKYEAVIEPWIKGRGVDWEVQIKDICDRDLWHENGRSPPAIGSVEETIWKKENRPVPDDELAAIKATL
ncbi:4-oxalocrotonate tautomerase [Mycena indigotica]|uniref:4-oxalocrotonate tautomerase n=1 Tax=Mycena indigotica TaxID=2126181 RepID=A0A8H6W3G6_9AGAR|nr:4-oxalocrotonate tautomerase [Mycena indigotica]KAF7303587.1 4-oxalocrotonate tautomerase [Mycena indigotica]